MQFRTLMFKNFTYWKRHWVSSVVQFTVPLVILLALVVIRAFTTTVSTAGLPSTPTYFFTNASALNLTSVAALQALNKKCMSKSGGSVALAPQNDVTLTLSAIFNRTGYRTIFFEDDAAIDRYIADPQYNDFPITDPTNAKTLICFGISFTEFGNQSYAYNLRFNQSNFFRKDYFDGSQGNFSVPFRLDAPEHYAAAVTNGTLAVKSLVDSLILRRETNVMTVVSAMKMPAPATELSDFMLLEIPLIIAVVLAVIVPFLRIVSLIVSEREAMVLDTLENMGMSRWVYLTASLLFLVAEQLLFGLVFAGLLKLTVLTQTSFLVLLLTYYFFFFAMTMTGFLLSSFFFQARIALVVAAGLLAAFVAMQIVRMASSGYSRAANTSTAFNPVAAVGFLLNLFVNYESAHMPFTIDLMGATLNNFEPGTTWLIMGLEGVVFLVLGLYFFYVIPFEFGIAKHPLFFLGCPWRRRGRNAVHSYSSDPNEPRPDVNGLKTEVVEQVLAMQKESNRTVSTDCLGKIYRNGKIALSDVTLDLFQDQIFVLIGPNGAGKTTFVSIISGLLEATQGQVSVLGRHPVNERKWIRSNIGCCPQANPLIPYLTVQEHLELIGKIKVGDRFSQTEITTLLSDLNLTQKKDALCDTLSGGQKRKLCVALALVGNSPIVLLDEPTSGMDPVARRQLWDVLKKYKENRILLLTTHNMDEADYLGDRIGFMKGGSLVAVGSPLFLKNKFGMSYILNVILASGTQQPAVDGLKKVVERTMGGFELVSESAKEVKFRLPIDKVAEFSQLLSALENTPNLPIRSFSISQTTLDEVFVKIISSDRQLEPISAQDVSADEDKLMNSRKALLESAMGTSDVSALNGAVTGSGRSLLMEPGCARFTLQLYGLVIKRFKNLYRNWFTLIMEVIFPIVLIVVSFFIIRINFVANADVVPVSSALYPQTVSFPINNLGKPTNVSLSAADLIPFVNPNYTTTLVTAADIPQFETSLNVSAAANRTFGLFFSALTPALANFTFFFNSTAPLAGLLAIDTASNALLRLLSKNKAAYIKSNLSALPNTAKVSRLDSSGDGFLIVCFISTAFTFMATSIVAVLVSEREKDSKHQQLISGVRVFTYWLSNFIVDYIKYLVLAMLLFACFFIFNVGYFTKDPAGVMSFLMLLWYGFPFLFTIYLFSLFFRRAFVAQVFTFIFVFFSSFFLISVVNALRFPARTRNLDQSLVQNLFRLIPFFAFGNGFLNMANLTLYVVIYDLNYTPDAIGVYGAIFDFFFLVIETFVILFVILGIEGREYVKETLSCCRRKKGPNTLYEQIMAERADKDPFVLAEEKNAETAQNPDVLMQNVSKYYKVNSIFERRREVKAVDNVSLVVEPGCVLGLLGANGAGKSTTFRMLTADITPTHGVVRLRGRMMPGQIDQMRSMIGYCPQTDNLFDFLTVREHLELFARLKGVRPMVQDAIISSLLLEFNLRQFEHVLANQLSGGNKRKLSVAIAFLGHPPLIFLDEPTSGMDPDAKLYIRRAILRLANAPIKSSVVLTTHSMEEAENSTSKIAILVDGRLQTVGSTQEIRRKYANGYQIEIKVELPDQNYYTQAFTAIQTQLGFLPNKEVDPIEIAAVLAVLQLPALKDQISDHGSGAFLKARLDKQLLVPLRILIEWANLAMKMELLKQVMAQYFGGVVIECIHSFIKFRTPPSQQISQMFNYLEGNKRELFIREYAFREISLEQIFVEFVRKALNRGGELQVIAR